MSCWSRCVRLSAATARDTLPHSVWSGARVSSLLAPNAALARKYFPSPSLSTPNVSIARKYFYCRRQMLPLRGSIVTLDAKCSTFVTVEASSGTLASHLGPLLILSFSVEAKSWGNVSVANSRTPITLSLSYHESPAEGYFVHSPTSAVSSSSLVHYVNDQVWAVGSSAFAEYAVAKCSQMSLKPSGLEFMPEPCPRLASPPCRCCPRLEFLGVRPSQRSPNRNSAFRSLWLLCLSSNREFGFSTARLRVLS